MSVIDELYHLDEQQYELLYRGNNAEVRQYRQYRWLNLGGDLIQSVMDIKEPHKLLNPVNQYMLGSLLLLEKCSDVLNIGFGGGVFERFLSCLDPDISIHSVENDEVVVHLSREFFHIQEEYPVYLQSADNFVSATDGHYDLILCDIFTDEKHPVCLLDAEFYSDCRRCLNDDGLLVMNLVPEDESELLEILKAVRDSFRHINLLEIPEHQNVILYISANEIKLATNNYTADFLSIVNGFNQEKFERQLKVLTSG